MKTFILLSLVAISLTEDALKAILRSPKATFNLYRNFKESQNLQFGANEERLRFQLFRENAVMVAEANSHHDPAVLGLNFFSTMTSAEQKQWLGLNATDHSENPILPQMELSTAPAKVLWTNEGKVTAVKNQGSCGSCWTYGAVGGLETRYAVIAGKLKSFAEQEYLDCVYEGQQNGCNGGWPDNCYAYSVKQGSRLASTRDYPYTGRDSTCKGGEKMNALIAADIVGSTRVSGSEDANIQALASGSLSVAFQVTNYFRHYSHGIIKDRTCTGQVNHAVTAVGYTENFVLVKNSWGTSWGEQGFVKFVRGYHNCGLFTYSSYPQITSTGVADSDPEDAATPYRPSEDDVVPTVPADCVDSATGCEEIKFLCSIAKVKAQCKKTCMAC